MKTVSCVKTYPRLWSVDRGLVMVVTDLHGDWDAYTRYRDRFTALHKNGEADFLVLCGDLIHAEPPRPDASLEIVLDVLRLRQSYGDAIIYLCGNHELPHIYSFGLARGKVEYTPRFEHALSASSQRAAVTQLLFELPLYIRTAAGVSLTHAGAAPGIDDATSALELFNWDHAAELRAAEASLAGEDIAGLREAYAALSGAPSYAALARHYLAVESTDDPRYNDLLRGSIAMAGSRFIRLYDALFTGCERQYGTAPYALLLQTLLRHLSTGYAPQHTLVAGHMRVSGGHKIIAGRHFRLASAAHATPRTRGQCLTFDAACPIADAAALLSGLRNIPASTAE